MTWTAFVLAALRALPALVALISAIKASADAKANQGLGYDQAVADAVEASRVQLEQADAAVNEARQKQAENPGDAGRDTQFRRD